MIVQCAQRFNIMKQTINLILKSKIITFNNQMHHQNQQIHSSRVQNANLTINNHSSINSQRSNAHSNYNSKRFNFPLNIKFASKSVATNAIDEIEQHLQQNQQNILTMEHFLQSKRTELTELQNYLIREFQDMEIWKQQRQNVVRLFGFHHEPNVSQKIYDCKKNNQSICQILKDFKQLTKNMIEQYRNIFNQILKETVEIFKIKLAQKDKQLCEKSNILYQSMQTINKLKLELGKSHISKGSTTNLRELARQVSLKKILSNVTNTRSNNGNSEGENKSLSKSSFLESHTNYKIKSKQRDRSRFQVSKSPTFDQKQRQKQRDRSNQRYLKSFKNALDQNKKILKSPTSKKIAFQVHRNVRQEYQNMNVKFPSNVDHKKYVKQKIQCLKSKNSGIFNDYRQLKAQRRF